MFGGQKCDSAYEIIMKRCGKEHQKLGIELCNHSLVPSEITACLKSDVGSHAEKLKQAHKMVDDYILTNPLYGK